MRKGISWVLLSAVFIACNHSGNLGPAGYQDYFRSDDSHILREVTTGTMTYKVRLLTPEVFALNSSVDNGSVNKVQFDDRIKDIRDNTYFIIDVEGNEGKGLEPEKKALVVGYYQGMVRSLISLELEDGRMLQPSYVNYEDNYGLAPYDRLLICFNNNLKNVPGKMVLRYNDRLNGNAGIHAAFDKKDIESLPKLNF